jgi:hypothetical protein
MTDTDREPRQGESLSSTIKRLVEAAAPEGVTMRDLQPQLETTPPTSIAATLSQLRGNRHETGIIRIGPGEYAYRPDNLEADTGDAAPPVNRGVKATVLEVLKGSSKPLGSPGIDEILKAEFGIEYETRQINQALTSLVRDDPHVERVATGVYFYNHQASVNNSDFLTEAIPDAALEEGTGLKIVARTQDGKRIAVDEKGVAWGITIKIESKLL